MSTTHLHNAIGGVYPNGNATLVAGATIKEGQPLKFSSGAVVPTSGVTDVAIGIALDGAASGDIVPVAILGAFTGTVRLLAADAIDIGAQITAKGDATATSGDVIIGRALEAAAQAGDIINITHQVAHVL